MKIHRFKQWYQVVNNGYTLAQFLTWAEADFYRKQRKPFEDICLQRVSQRKGYTMRRINVYPN